MAKSGRKISSLWMYTVLAGVTFAVFSQVLSHKFVNFDDDCYVTENKNVSDGLTLRAVKWAFTTGHTGNWHPLTWLSHIADCELFGLNPTGHHLTNLLLHILNVLVLFCVLKAATGAVWQSFFVAAAFALHPLHVESVAWIAERKDVLSTLFGFLSTATYIRYTAAKSKKWYTASLSLFALGLLSKPMLVTLPFVFLVLDYWPLNRDKALSKTKTGYRQLLPRLVAEKWPFFVLSAVSGIVTFLVQRSGGALSNLEKLPLSIRSANAVISYVRYAGKMFWPSGLAVHHPYASWVVTGGKTVAAIFVLTVVTVLVVRLAGRYRYLLAGWLIFLGTLVPVIGLVQVGSQAWADRYTYMPLTGLFIIIAWGLGDFFAKWRYKKAILGAMGFCALAAMLVCTVMQLRYWRDSITLFERAIAVTTDNAKAHNNLGVALAAKNRFAEAVEHYRRAIEIKPEYGRAYYNLGIASGRLGRHEEAVEAFRRSLEIEPQQAQAYYNLGVAYGQLGRSKEEMDAYRAAVRIEPQLAEAHFNLGIGYLRAGDKKSAFEEYRALQRLNSPLAAELLNVIGATLSGKQR